MGLAVFAFPLFQSRLVPMLEEVGQKPRKKRLASFTDFNSAFFPTGTRRMSNMPWMRENPFPTSRPRLLDSRPGGTGPATDRSPTSEGVYGFHHRSAGSVSSVSSIHCFIFMTSFFLAFSQQSVGIRSVGPTRLGPSVWTTSACRVRMKPTLAARDVRTRSTRRVRPTLILLNNVFSRAAPGWHNVSS